MFTKPYIQAVEEIAAVAPDLHGVRGPTKFFEWAETVVDVLVVVYDVDADDCITSLTEAVKNHQDYED